MFGKLTKTVAALALSALLLVGCTEEKTVVAPPVDHLAPLVQWVAPASGAELAGEVELSFTAYDEGSISRIQLYRSGMAPADWNIPPHPDTLYSLPWDTRDVADDLYILEARAWDEAGNLGISPSLVVKVRNNPEPPPEDRTPPDVWWMAPEAGSTLKDTVRLDVRVFDESGVDSVRLLKDGEVVATIFPPYDSRGGVRGGEYEMTYLWDTHSDSDGVHIWEARAWDAARNTGVSAGLLVKVRNNPEPPPEDRTPPVIVWRAPQPGDTVEGLVEIRFDAMDDDAVDSVRLFVNGATPAVFNLPGHPEVAYSVNWDTRDCEDGTYWLEVRARDRAGNLGVSDPLSLTLWNSRPRVIWVPDDYETIQGAINASRDGDSVRARAGIYREGLRLMGKRIWLESEEGPERTEVDATGWEMGIYVGDNEDSNTVIRGFRVLCDWMGALLLEDTSPRLYNCIFQGRQGLGVNIYNSYGRVMNCIILGSAIGIRAWISWGAVHNTMFLECGTALCNYAVSHTAFEYGYNLMWNNEENYRGYEPSPNDIESNPLFREGSYIPSENSPAIDAGMPSIIDRDSTRSDIGLYGGTYSYPPDNR